MYILRLSSIDSTNNYLKELYQNTQIKTRLCVSSNYQTHGRGQFENKWHGNPNENLYCSFFFPFDTEKTNPYFKDNHTFAIVMISSLAIIKTLTALKIANSYIKWPNDILLNDRKIAGILIENLWSSNTQTQSVSQPKGCIIGIGLNINQEKFPIPNASSLYCETKQQYSVTSIQEQITKNLEAYWNNTTEHYQTLKKEYESYLYRKDKVCSFILNQKTVTRIPKGVDQNGKLLLENPMTKDTEAYNLKEIQFCYKHQAE